MTDCAVGTPPHPARSSGKLDFCPDLETIPTAPHPDDRGDAQAPLPEHWRGLLVPYDVMSPDGRVISRPKDGIPKSRDMPLPLTAQVATADGHDNSIPIGITTRIWSQDDGLWGEGKFDLGTPEGRDWAGRVGRGMAGWGSVDLDAGSAPRVQSQGERKVPKRTYPDWSYAGFTLVTRPAFDAARIFPYWPEEEPELPEPDDEDDDDVAHPRNSQMPPEVEKMLADVDVSAVLDGVTACGCGEADPDPETFTASGSTSLPLADRTAPWDGTEAEKRMRAHAGVDGPEPTPDQWDRYGQGFFWRAPQASKLGDFKLPFADVIDGTLTAVPRGIFASAGAVQGARGGVDIPEDDVAPVRSRISSYYQKLKMKTPWDSASTTASLLAHEPVLVAGGTYAGTVTGFDADGGWLRISCDSGMELVCSADEVAHADSLTAAISAGPLAPPDEWFTDPALTAATPLQVLDDGRVFGHLALWGTCHVGFADTCVTAPRSMSSYGHFHVGEVVLASGSRLPVGKLTIGGGHAAPAAGWRAAAAHYDNTGTAVAVVRAGEDSYGIWVAGALVPEVSATQVAALRRSPLSGDWRRIGGNLELVAALAVNTPGFPIPRPRAGLVASRQASLVAAGVLDREEFALGDRIHALVTSALEDVLEAYAERRQRAAAAAARIAELTGTSAAGGCGCGSGHEE